MPLTLTSEARFLNPKACGFQGPSLGEGCGGPRPPPTFFLAKWINSWTNYFQNFKSVQICMKDAECAENNKKSIVKFLRFFDFGVWLVFFVNFSMIFVYKIDHNSKTKNCKNRKISKCFIVTKVKTLGNCEQNRL